MKIIPELSFLHSGTKEAVEEMHNFKGTYFMVITCKCNPNDSIYFHFFPVVNKISFALNCTFFAFMKTFKLSTEKYASSGTWE